MQLVTHERKGLLNSLSPIIIAIVEKGVFLHRNLSSRHLQRIYSCTFVPLLKAFFKSKGSLKNWARSLEANFQVIEAQSLLVSDGI